MKLWANLRFMKLELEVNKHRLPIIVRLVIDPYTIPGGTATTEQQQLLLNYTEAWVTTLGYHYDPQPHATRTASWFHDSPAADQSNNVIKTRRIAETTTELARTHRRGPRQLKSETNRIEFKRERRRRRKRTSLSLQGDGGGRFSGAGTASSSPRRRRG